MSTHICGAGLAFMGFAATLVIGLWVNNPFITVVQRALCVLVLFYPLGCLLAALGRKVIQENFDAHVKSVENQNESTSNDEKDINPEQKQQNNNQPQPSVG